MSGLRNRRNRLRSIAILAFLGSAVSFSGRVGALERPVTSDDIPLLLRQLDSGQADLSYEAAQKLASLGPVVLAGLRPQLGQLIRTSIYAHTRVMADELSEGRTPVMKPEAIRLAVEMLRLHPDDPRAGLVAAMLREVEPPHAPAGPQQSQVFPVAALPAPAPANPPPPEPPVWDRDIPKWVDALGSWENAVRIPAAQSLATAAAHDPKGTAIGPLRAALNSVDNDFRIEVAEALRSYGHAAVSAAPALSRMVDNANPTVRVAAVRALLRIDAPAGSLDSALIASIVQHDPSCCNALAAHISEEAAPKLLLQLTEMSRSDPDARVRAMALAAEDEVERLAPANRH